MARHDIDKAGVRNKLEPRREPYWGSPVERGLFVGFRRLDKGGNWVARYRTEEGQKYRALGAATDTNDYAEACKAARRWKKEMDAGVKTHDVITVGEACRAYMDQLRRDGREETALDVEQRFNRTVFADPLGKVKLSALRERHLEEWRERMEQGHLSPVPVKGARAPKPLSPAVFKRTLTTLKAALNNAVRKRYVASEKAIEWSGMKPAKDADKRRELYLDRSQRQALLEAAVGPLRDLIECVALTGCRPGDPAKALRKHYDAKTQSVTFLTKGHVRTIPLSPAAKALFDRLAKDKLPNAHLFTQGNGKPWTSRAWHDGMRAAVAKAGLPEGTVLYTLRHSWITDAITGGMDLLTVAKLAGTSLAMIEKHYGHLVHGAARDKLASLRFL